MKVPRIGAPPHPAARHPALARAPARAAPLVAARWRAAAGDEVLFPPVGRGMVAVDTLAGGRPPAAAARRGSRSSTPPPAAATSARRRRSPPAFSRSRPGVHGARGRHAGVRLAALSRHLRRVVQRDGRARAEAVGRALPLVGAARR